MPYNKKSTFKTFKLEIIIDEEGGKRSEGRMPKMEYN